VPLAYTGSFTTGDVVAPRHKCLMPVIGGGDGENISPPLEWTGGPAETQSFGLVLYDTRYNQLHWVVWDIPASANALPEGIPAGFGISDPAGAHQVSRGGHEYYGPCSTGARAGTYEYRLHALNVPTLALDETASPASAQAAVEAASLAAVVWAGTPE
jgi:hypothetical protein